MIRTMKAEIFVCFSWGILMLLAACSAGSTTVSITGQVGTAVPHSITIGSSTLTWDAPTNYTDNSPLTVDHYKVYYGTVASDLTGSFIVSTGTATDFSNIFTGTSTTYFFAVTALDKDGNESDRSNVASKFIAVPAP